MSLQSETVAYLLRSVASMTLINGDRICIQDGKWFAFMPCGSSRHAGFDTLAGLLMAMTEEQQAEMRV